MQGALTTFPNWLLNHEMTSNEKKPDLIGSWILSYSIHGWMIISAGKLTTTALSSDVRQTRDVEPRESETCLT